MCPTVLLNIWLRFMCAYIWHMTECVTSRWRNKRREKWKTIRNKMEYTRTKRLFSSSLDFYGLMVICIYFSNYLAFFYTITTCQVSVSTDHQWQEEKRKRPQLQKKMPQNVLDQVFKFKFFPTSTGFSETDQLFGKHYTFPLNKCARETKRT